jgi:hypothetical protein
LLWLNSQMGNLKQTIEHQNTINDQMLEQCTVLDTQAKELAVEVVKQ